MRNPIRLKNLSLRLAPLYGLGVILWLIAEPTPGSLLSGLCLVVVGLGLRGWAVGYLVKTERLAISGPYAHVRNPLYLGSLLVGAGFAAMLGAGVGVLALAALGCWFGFSYFPRKERIESDRLQARYGDVYEIYHAQVPALWPQIRAWAPGAPVAEQLEGDRHWQFKRYDANNELGTLLACAAGVSLVALRVVLV